MGFMIGVALVIIYSILVISLKGRGSTHDSDIQKSLLVVSDKPEQSMLHTQSTIELPGLVQLKKPEPVADATERTVPELRTTPLIDDVAENSDKTSIQVCTLRAKDSVECELNAATAAMAEARPHATSVQEHVTNDEQKTQTKVASTAATAAVAAKEVMPSPLTGNKPIAVPTEALGIKTIPVTKTGATSSETATQKNLPKKTRKIFSGEGVIQFLYHTKEYGIIRLSEPNEWGEFEVFFHRRHLAGNTDIHQGQNVKVKYVFRRGSNKGTSGLNACRVETTSPPRYAHSHSNFRKKWSSSSKWARTAPAPNKPKSWRARSGPRRSASPPKHRAKTTRSLRAAKAPWRNVK